MMIRRTAFGAMTAAALVATLSAAALADTNSSNNTSTTTADQAKPKSFADNIYASYFGIVAGPALGDISVNTHDSTGAASGTIGIDHRLTVGYKLSKQVSMGLYGRVITVYPTADSPAVSYRNPGLKVSHSSLIKSGNFNMAGSALLYAPVTAGSIRNKMITGVNFGQLSTLEIPGSRWSVIGLTNQIITMYGEGAPIGAAPDITFAAYAGLNYQWKSNLALTFSTGASFDHYLGMGLDGIKRTPDAADIEIGASWDISKKVNLNPYVALYPLEGISANSTSLGMYVSASLL